MAELRLVEKKQVIPSNVVQGLEALIEGIKSGDVTEIALIASDRNDDIHLIHHVYRFPRAIGCVALLQKRILEAWEDE